MTERTDPGEAAALLRPTDVVGIPLGPGHPAASCTPSATAPTGSDLLVSGALLTDLYEVFTQPGRAAS